MIYFTSDTHFGHANIIKHCNRPFLPFNSIPAVDVMDWNMIARWNDVVKGNDQVYFLGDLSFYNAEKTIHLVAELKGKKYWITGNHDHKLIKDTELTSMFEWVKPIETLHIQDPTAPKGNGYNISSGGDGGDNISNLSKEEKLAYGKKQSVLQLIAQNRPEVKQKKSESGKISQNKSDAKTKALKSHKGKKLNKRPEEYKRKMSEVQIISKNKFEKKPAQAIAGKYAAHIRHHFNRCILNLTCNHCIN